ncbi:hypothetical protein ACFSR7_23635 [Cohnella sp. GCM10020058]|uniref:hypothetical protein n=1 Tax=Cohnella sp. GCM10020058 TaxID=3317330 RepID=UPI0036448A72
MARTKQRKAYEPEVMVIAIEPAPYHRKRVRMVNVKTGERHEVYFGDSISEASIYWRAPFVAKGRGIK